MDSLVLFFDSIDKIFIYKIKNILVDLFSATTSTAHFISFEVIIVEITTFFGVSNSCIPSTAIQSCISILDSSPMRVFAITISVVLDSAIALAAL